MLAGLDRAVMVPHLPEISAHIGGNPPQSRLVVEGLGEGCSLAQVVEHLPDFSECPERTPQVEPEVDGLLLRGAALREMLEGCQCLLEARHGLSKGRTRERLGTGLPTVRHGLVPDLAPEGMLGQPFRLLGQTVGIEPFAGFDDAGVQGTAPLLQETAVGHLVGEGVLEGVFEFGEEAGFVEELGGLQVAETAAQFLLGQLRDGLQEGEGHLSADDRRGLEEPLLLGRQAVDAGRQDGLHRGGDLQALEGLCQAIGAALADQHPGFHQGPDALFQEKGVALGALDQEPLERHQAGVVPQQGLQQFLGARGGQGVEPELRVVGFISPAVLVLGAVVDEQEQAGGGQALDQAVEDRLGLGVDPVQVLEDQEQRLHLALAQQQVLDGLEGALAALRGIEVLPLSVLHWHVQERQEGRQGRPEGRIQGEELAGELLAASSVRRRGRQSGSRP